MLMIKRTQAQVIGIFTMLITTLSFAAESKPVFLYSRYYNAKGENRYEPGGSFKDLMRRLEQDFVARTHDRPLTAKELADVNVLLICNPSDKAASNNPAPPHISSADIEVLTDYVRKGGGLIVTSNQEDHNLDVEDMNKLLSKFGLQFTNVYTDFKKLTLPKSTPLIGGLNWAFYSGNQIQIQQGHPARPRAVVSNDVNQPIVKGSRNPAGVLMAIAEPGKGRVVLTTDTGWMNDVAFSGEGIPGVAIKEQDNWEIMRRLSLWAAGKKELSH